MANCAHSDPPDIMLRAEEWLNGRGVGKESWPGMTVRHAENTPGGRWESVVIDIERRGSEWIVTKIDRRPAPLDSSAGFSVVA